MQRTAHRELSGFRIEVCLYSQVSGLDFYSRKSQRQTSLMHALCGDPHDRGFVEQLPGRRAGTAAEAEYAGAVPAKAAPVPPESSGGEPTTGAAWHDKLRIT
jgi:hypothetical protein